MPEILFSFYCILLETLSSVVLVLFPRIFYFQDCLSLCFLHSFYFQFQLVDTYGQIHVFFFFNLFKSQNCNMKPTMPDEDMFSSSAILTTLSNLGFYKLNLLHLRDVYISFFSSNFLEDERENGNLDKVGEL